MQTFSLKHLASVVVLALAGGAMLAGTAQACTRATFQGDQNLMLTGRSMDWMQDPGTKLWVFPRGMQRDGAAGPDAPTWASKYGSVVASFYDIATVDGMNEKGLVANHLYLAESDYGSLEGKPPMSIGLWAQYILDNYATVNEAVTALAQEPFRLVAPTLPNGSAATGHMALSDPSGDSAVLEYINGKLVIHHGKQYNVMTNSPPFDQQLVLTSYWNSVGGEAFLPGTARAADRFVRASFLVDSLPRELDKNVISAVPGRTYENQAVAQLMSVMRGVSVPLGMTTPGQPNIASTFWRTLADQTQLVWYYDSATMPNAFWVDFADLDFSPQAPARMLDLTQGEVYAGNVAQRFGPAPAFTWLQAKPVEKS